MGPVTRRWLRFVPRTALLLLLLIGAGLTSGVLAPSPGAAQATTPPVVTSITPDAGPASGGAPVTITGSGFDTRPGATRFRGVASFFQSRELGAVDWTFKPSSTSTLVPGLVRTSTAYFVPWFPE